MNKQFNAVALANKALRKENTELWEENDTIRKGMEEMHAMYEAMVAQLVARFGEYDEDGSQTLKLDKIDVSALMGTHRLEAQNTETGLLLRLAEVQDEPEHQD